jgi:hypothetical protein
MIKDGIGFVSLKFDSGKFYFHIKKMLKWERIVRTDLCGILILDTGYPNIFF